MVPKYSLQETTSEIIEALNVCIPPHVRAVCSVCVCARVCRVEDREGGPPWGIQCFVTDIVQSWWLMEIGSRPTLGHYQCL